MKNLVFGILLSVWFGSISAQTFEEISETTPKCAEARKCEVMWHRAQEAVSMLSNMRIRLMTDTRIETFAPSRYGATGATVTKVPVGDSGYEIRIQIECYRSTDCESLQRSGKRLFNSQVSDAPSNQPILQSSSATDSQSDLALADKTAIQSGCGISQKTSKIVTGATFSVFSVGCANGEIFIVRCEKGGCRTLH